MNRETSVMVGAHYTKVDKLHCLRNVLGNIRLV